MFSSECAEIALPYKNYHMETAFENANKEWAIEMMGLVVARILKWYDDDIPLDATIVTQENETVLIDRLQTLQPSPVTDSIKGSSILPHQSFYI